MKRILLCCRAILTAFMLLFNLLIAAIFLKMVPEYPKYDLGYFDSGSVKKLPLSEASRIVSWDAIIVGLCGLAITVLIMNINEMILSKTIENYGIARKSALLFTALVTSSIVIGFISGVVSGFRERVAF